MASTRSELDSVLVRMLFGTLNSQFMHPGSQCGGFHFREFGSSASSLYLPGIRGGLPECVGMRPHQDESLSSLRTDIFPDELT
jgi:hypothetical protein